MGTPVGDHRVCHFRLSLVSASPDGEETSIRLDINPSYTDMNHPMRSALVVEYKAYRVSNTAGTDRFNAPLSQPQTAADLCRYLLETHRLDLYEFTVDGTGCFHWCAVVLEKLAQGNFVDANVKTSFQEYERVQAARFGSMIPMGPRVVGTFYDL